MERIYKYPGIFSLCTHIDTSPMNKFAAGMKTKDFLPMQICIFVETQRDSGEFSHPT